MLYMFAVNITVTILDSYLNSFKLENNDNFLPQGGQSVF